MGAGIIGLACAWRLSQRGVAVRVFDAREAACEASWAAAGMLAPGGEIETPSVLATAALASRAEYPEFVRELAEESGCPIDFRPCGAMEVAYDENEAFILELKSARQATIGVRSEPCQYEGRTARFYPDDALVDPRDVTRALLEACRRRGVTLHQQEPVLSVSPSGTSIQTTKGEYSGQGVLLAAGAWSSALLPALLPPDLLPRTMPVRGHLMSWNLAPGLLEPILRHGHTYLAQRTSGLLIAGATTEHVGFDRTIDASAVADLRARASALLPVLEHHLPAEQWIGFRPGVDAEGPAVGRLPGTSLWTAFGHYRNGILLAPETARRITASYSSQSYSSQ